ncbi:UNVERIFIED_CONTAM: hypothetical protein O8I53_05430 [Campylobacter lari]
MKRKLFFTIAASGSVVAAPVLMVSCLNKEQSEAKTSYEKFLEKYEKIAKKEGNFALATFKTIIDQHKQTD